MTGWTLPLIYPIFLMNGFRGGGMQHFFLPMVENVCWTGLSYFIKINRLYRKIYGIGSMPAFLLLLSKEENGKWFASAVYMYICTYVQFFFHKTLVTKGLFILLLHVSSEANKIKNERHSWKNKLCSTFCNGKFIISISRFLYYYFTVLFR